MNKEIFAKQIGYAWSHASCIGVQGTMLEDSYRKVSHPKGWCVALARDTKDQTSGGLYETVTRWVSRSKNLDFHLSTLGLDHAYKVLFEEKRFGDIDLSKFSFNKQ